MRIHRRGISRDAAVIVIGLSLLFLYLCWRPIWHTDVWGHLAYGRVIWETGSIPKTEPHLPLSKTMPFVDPPWLGQIIGYAIVSCPRLGIAGLQGLFAVLLTGCAALLVTKAYRHTQSVWAGFVAAAVFLMIGWQPLLVLRPQSAGIMCFVAVLTRLTFVRMSRSDWLVVPLIFALWANLHASFLVGLGLLGCLLAGRWSDVFLRTKSLPLAICTRSAKRLGGVIVLAGIAVLLNPYSTRLYGEALRFSLSENLKDLTEWQPLNIRDGQGMAFAGGVAGLILVYRLTPRSVRTWELLSLLGLGLATLWSSRMLVWWAAIAGLLLAIHGNAACRRQRLPRLNERSIRSVAWMNSALVVALVCFGASPLGMAILADRQPDLCRAVSSRTPVFAAEYLRDHPPVGLVFNTYEWGDYLLWAGPRDVELFVNSHAHLIPRDVWDAYMQVTELKSGWQGIFDEYDIRTVVVDRLYREALIQGLSVDDRWQQPPIECDGQVIFLRK